MGTNTLGRAGLGILVAALLAGAGIATADPDPSKEKKKDGYVVITTQMGILECAVGAGPIVTSDLCGGGGIHSFAVPQDADVGLIELRWTQASALGGRTLALLAPASLEGAGHQSTQGQSPLSLGLKSQTEGGTPAAGAISASVRPATDSGLVLEQRYEIAFSVFVDMDIPPGYTAFP